MLPCCFLSQNIVIYCCTNTIKIFVWNSNGVNLSIKPFTKYLSTVLYCLLASTVIWLYILSHNFIYKLLSCECIYRSRETSFDRLKTYTRSLVWNTCVWIVQTIYNTITIIRDIFHEILPWYGLQIFLQFHIPWNA